MLIVALVGCSGNNDRRTIDIYAASSLADIMELMEQRYEHDNPDVDIRMNLAGTNALVRQINSGADAAILIAADASFLDDLVEAPSEAPSSLATNQLTLVVPSNNPAAVTSPADLGNDGVLTARCATGVPCGDATDRYLTTVGVAPARTTDEANVRSVLTKVAAGEVDAGFVYRTDAEAADQAVIEIPLNDGPRVTITMARLNSDELTIDVAHYLTSADVSAMFDELGFGPMHSEEDGE